MAIAHRIPEWDNSTLVAVIATLSLPVLTYCYSTFRFQQAKRSQRPGREPPTVPYWLPWACHALPLATGASAFFAHAIKKHGGASPFLIRAGPMSFLIVRDAKNVKRVFQASTAITSVDIHAQIYERVMGMPIDLLPFYQPGNNESTDAAHYNLSRKHLSGEPLIKLSETYVTLLRKDLAQDILKLGASPETRDLWQLVQHHSTHAIIETLFGSTIFEIYPEVVADFWEIDGYIDFFARNMPRIAAPSAYRTRDRMIHKLKIWLEHSEAARKENHLVHEDWHPVAGSNFMRHRDHTLAAIPGFNVEGRASEILALMVGAISNTIPSTFWTIFEALRNPAIRERLNVVFKDTVDVKKNHFDTQEISSNTFVQSFGAEIGRVRMGSPLMRQCVVDGFQLGDYTIRKGTSVLMFSSDLGLNEEAWRDARPEMLARPLTEFWAERFIVKKSEPSPGEGNSEEKVTKERFSTERVNALCAQFGGGLRLCPGRHLAKIIQVSTLAVLFSEYHVEFSQPSRAQAAIPPTRQAAFGAMKPSEPVNVRIEKVEK